MGKGIRRAYEGTFVTVEESKSMRYTSQNGTILLPLNLNIYRHRRSRSSRGSSIVPSLFEMRRGGNVPLMLP